MTSEIKTLCDEAESLLKGLASYLEGSPDDLWRAVAGGSVRGDAIRVGRRLREIVTIIRREAAAATELGRDMLCDGDGWRYLRHDETVREGDEFLDTSAMSFGWKPTRDAGEKAGPGMFYRRRVAPGVDPGEKHVPEIDPGKGWRLVKPDEILREGDEWLDTTGKTRWVPTASVGRVLPFASMTYRRRVEAAAPTAQRTESAEKDEARRHPRHSRYGTLPQASPRLLTDEEVEFLTECRDFPGALPRPRRITAGLLARLGGGARSEQPR